MTRKEKQEILNYIRSYSLNAPDKSKIIENIEDIFHLNHVETIKLFNEAFKSESLEDFLTEDIETKFKR